MIRLVGILAMTVLVLFAAIGEGSYAREGGTEADSKAVVEAFWNDVWEQQRFDRIDELFAEDFVIHSAGKAVGPREKFKAWVRSFFRHIEGLKLDVHDIFAEGDKVITRWTCSGRFVGEMFGVKGRGQPISFTGMNIMTVRDGRIVEAWVERDALGLARQIGAAK
jgi:steroid delta-isomerase-like uncharacterized protein